VRLEGLGKLKKFTSSGIRSVVPQPTTLPRAPFLTRIVSRSELAASRPATDLEGPYPSTYPIWVALLGAYAPGDQGIPYPLRPTLEVNSARRG
jgi:hypothetical protein